VTPRTCRICGCTQRRACPGGCHWVEADLCSACIGKDEERKHMFAKSGGDWIKPYPTAGEMFDAVDKEARRRGGRLLKKDDDTKAYPPGRGA